MADIAHDADLARAIQEAAPGEARAAEAALCERFGRRILAYGRRHLADDAMAADLTQRVLLVVLEKLRAGQVREPERIASFVLGTARTLGLEMRRRGGRESAELVEGAAPVVELPSTDPLGRERLQSCLDQLPVRERTVVVLTYFGDQDAPGIGASLGLASGNVRVIRHRAIDRLRRCMGLSEDHP